ncbi:hypothetical protein [Bacillus sp. JCM 19041]|uniref:hypothetical protein n=1 Tax=Bacillus sp. JCM 19041 TaxID=1460637 RepID=UPI0006D05193
MFIISVFLKPFIIVSIYSAPVYFLLGIPSSVVIDKIIHKGKRFDEYLFGLILYSLAGGIACIVTLFILGQNINFIGIIGASLLGCIAASLYYHLYIVVKKCGKKKRNKSSEKEAK